MNNNPGTVTHDKRYVWVTGTLCLLCGVLVFHFFGNSVRGYIDTASIFTWWVSQWFNDASETEHGPIILALSVWVFWRNLKEAPTQENKPRPYTGLLLILGGLGLHFIGYLVQQTRISIVGFLFFTIGSCYLAGGSRWGQASVFPVLFLFFSFPLEFLTDSVGAKLQLWVTQSVYSLAKLFGIDVIRVGSQLFSPDGSYQYDVAPVCSGIRSLVAISALSLLIGYLSFRTLWRRTLLFLLSMPYAVLGNILRVFCIILAAEWFGQEAGNFVHENFGFVVFIIVLGLAILTVSLIQRLFPEKKHRTPANVDSGVSEPMDVRGLAWKLGVVIVVFSLAVLALTKRVDKMNTSLECGVYLAPNQNDPVELPKLLDYEWVGKNQKITKEELKILPVDTGFSRKIYSYVDGGNKDVLFSIVLSGKDRSSIHKPETCLKAQGWSIKEESFHEFDIPGFASGKLKARLLRLEFTSKSENGESKVVPAFFAYWFVGGNTVVASNWQRMFVTARDRLFGFKTHRWAYIFAQTIILDGEEAGLERMQEVISLAVPEFQRVGFEDE